MSFSEQIQNLKDQMLNAVVYMTPIIGAFFAPALYVILLVVLITLVDTRLGVKRARFEKKPITSNRLSDLFAKLIGYGVFICVGLLLNKITNSEHVVWLSAVVPIYTEMKSINENQVAVGKKGIFKQIEECYQFALKIKRKKDKLR